VHAICTILYRNQDTPDPENLVIENRTIVLNTEILKRDFRSPFYHPRQIAAVAAEKKTLKNVENILLDSLHKGRWRMNI
jgi:hypothetical protein